MKKFQDLAYTEDKKAAESHLAVMAAATQEAKDIAFSQRGQLKNLGEEEAAALLSFAKESTQSRKK
jgi:hypothetical protein